MYWLYRFLWNDLKRLCSVIRQSSFRSFTLRLLPKVIFYLLVGFDNISSQESSILGDAHIAYACVLLDFFSAQTHNKYHEHIIINA